MAEKSLTLDELVRKLMGEEHADVLRETIAWFAGELMEAEVTQQIGAGLHEKSPECTAHRNGYRERSWQTRAGEVELAIPRLRAGSYFPSFLRAAQPLGEGPRRGHPGGLRQRRQYAQGRPPGDPARPLGHQQERRQPPLRRPRRAGAPLPRAAAGGAVPVPVAGRQGGARARTRRRAPQGAGGRLRRA